MKKFFASLLIIVSALFTLIGCSSDTSLPDMYQKWSSAHQPNYSETAIYTVKYKSDYDENDYNYSKSDDVKVEITIDSDLTKSYYKTVSSVVTASSIPTDKGLKVDANKLYYKLYSELQVSISYKTTDETLNFTDKVISTTYCRDIDGELAPVYSQKSFDTTNVASDNKSVVRYVYDTETIYNGDDIKYVLTDKTDKVTENNSYANYSLVKAVEESPYTVKTSGENFIDNETLLFATRNFSLSDTEELNVSIPSYFGVESVAVNIATTGSYTSNFITVNGVKIEKQIPSIKTAIGITGSSFTGSPMIVTYQKDVIEGTEYNNRFMLEVVTRLPSKSGAIVYTLDNVTITK